MRITHQMLCIFVIFLFLAIPALAQKPENVKSSLVDGAYNEFVLGDYTYAAVGDAGLYIYNIYDQRNPNFCSQFLKGTSIYDVHARTIEDGRTIAYICADETGLITADVSNPFDPVQLGSLPDVLALRIYVAGDFAYVASGDELYIIDVSTPETPDVVHTNPIDARDVKVAGNRAYVVTDQNLVVLDVTDPSNPLVLTQID